MGTTNLNLLQRLLRTWEAVHPYNAAQVATIAAPCNAASIQAAWTGALAMLGLGEITVAGRELTHEVESTPAPVRMLAPTTCAASHLNAELNRPFDNGDGGSPFRPFVIPRSDAESICGIVYRHWVADSVSIRTVLSEWLFRLAGKPAWRHRPVRRPLAGEGYGGLCARRHSSSGPEEHFLGLFRQLMRLRRVRKPIHRGGGDYRARVLIRETESGLPERLRAVCRRQRIKVPDALLAALAEACQQHVPLQTRTNRRDVAVGNIVDLRPQRGGHLDGFGLYLGFTQLVCRPSDILDWPRLLRRAAAHRAAQGKSDITHSSTAWWATGMAMHRLIRPERLYDFYRKQIPLAAGLSNVRVDDSCDAAGNAPPLLNYIRIAPTGPVAPVVLSTTTLGDRMQLALTYRPAVLDAEGANAMLDTFSRRITCMANDAKK